MPRFIHLNGPAGIGKSTIARMYVERHPGVLNLDADQIVSLIGGWQDNFWETVRAARLLAISMAETHLGGGQDVVMPQLVTQAEEAERIEAAVRRAGAQYLQIVLMAEKEQVLDRFATRTVSEPSTALRRGIDEVVARGGGPALLTRIHDHVTDFLSARPDCIVVQTGGRDTQQTYDDVITVLAAGG